jgi:hypothetical protein
MMMSAKLPLSPLSLTLSQKEPDLVASPRHRRRVSPCVVLRGLRNTQRGEKQRDAERNREMQRETEICREKQRETERDRESAGFPLIQAARILYLGTFV